DDPAAQQQQVQRPAQGQVQAQVRHRGKRVPALAEEIENRHGGSVVAAAATPGREAIGMSVTTKAKAHASAPIKGRGSASYVSGRYETATVHAQDDGWDSLQARDDTDPAPHPDTRVHEETARSIISRNDSPDVGFSQSVNPYRGCEHGCVYCFARPSHAYLQLSPGLDFETRLFAKTNAPERLRAELSRKGYRCAP